MVCVQCGTDNAEHAKYCSKCSALLFQAAPTGAASHSTLDMDEGFDPPVPDQHYQSPLLEQLAWAVHDFIEEEGELEPVVESYEAFREVFESFQQEVPNIREIHYEGQEYFEEDPNYKYVKYLLDRAQEYYTKGETLFEGYLESLEALGEDDDAFPDPEPLKEATRNWLDCNDHICMTFELLTNQFEALTYSLEEYNESLASGGQSDDGAAAVEEGAEA